MFNELDQPTVDYWTECPSCGQPPKSTQDPMMTAIESIGNRLATMEAQLAELIVMRNTVVEAIEGMANHSMLKLFNRGK